MDVTKPVRSTGHRAGTLRVGSVSYLNAKPLIYGLDDDRYVAMTLDVPSRLIDGLRDGRLDVALLPVIDYQRMNDLVVVPAGGIGCDGPTLTVRIFSKRPIERIDVLACDTDSHSSVALARVVLAEKYGLTPRFIDLRRDDDPPADAAQLLIGDKVVCEEPPGMGHQLDLGQAWKELTGRPFLFAVWVARAGIALGELPQRLATAKREGMAHLNEIIARHAVPRGWPAGLALQYMTIYLKYDVGAAQLDAVRLFHSLAAKYGMISDPPRELVVYDAGRRR